MEREREFLIQRIEGENQDQKRNSAKILCNIFRILSRLIDFNLRLELGL